MLRQAECCMQEAPAKMLIKWGADPDIYDNDGVSPKQIARFNPRILACIHSRQVTNRIAVGEPFWLFALLRHALRDAVMDPVCCLQRCFTPVAVCKTQAGHVHPKSMHQLGLHHQGALQLSLPLCRCPYSCQHLTLVYSTPAEGFLTA